MKRLFFTVFGGFCAVIVLIGVFNFYHFSAIHSYQKELVNADKLGLRLQNHKEQFQSLGQHREVFDSVAVHLDQWQKINQQFWKETTAIALKNQQKWMEKGFSIATSYTGRRQLVDLQHAEKELLIHSAKIGYKEEGYIGKMRINAHDIETKYPQFNERLFSLRRHEKDFLMRIDPIYAEKFEQEMSDWKKKQGLPDELIAYSAYFDSLKNAYLNYFQSNEDGYFYKWDKQFEKLQAHNYRQRSLLLTESFEASSKAQRANLILNSIAVFLAISCAIIFTRKFTKQISNLQLTMAEYISTNYQFNRDSDLRIPRNDFGKITIHFLKLTRKIRADMQLLEDRVQRRTKSLQLKNNLLEMQHLEIMDSLRYAQDLQQSLLVSRAKMLRSFKEAWVYYKPKNHVGGDFYWMKEVRENDRQLLYFALADCTGHGVPGALLSVMGMNALDELIESGIREPATLLNELRALVSRRLNTHEDKRYDGMDIALFVWNRHTNTLVFSGAQMPLWILRDGTLIETVGQRMAIGYTYFEVNSFENREITIASNDRLILFSDGIIDQFGGLKQKKLGRKALREWLTFHANDSSPLLFSKLVQQFEHWKGNTEQTDDCTMLILEPTVSIEVSSSSISYESISIHLPAC